MFVASREEGQMNLPSALIFSFINQREQGDQLNHESSSPLLVSWVRRPSQCIPHCQTRPLPSTCRRHLLSCNWVFIILPVRGRCCVFIWHNYQEKWRNLVAASPDNGMPRVQVAKQSESAWTFWRHRVFFIRHLVGICLFNHMQMEQFCT